MEQRRVDALERIAEQLERIATRLDSWDNRGRADVVVHNVGRDD